MNLMREKIANPDKYINDMFDRKDNTIVDYGCGTGFYCNCPQNLLNINRKMLRLAYG